jgi:hypothetical protein
MGDGNSTFAEAASEHLVKIRKARGLDLVGTTEEAKQLPGVIDWETKEVVDGKWVTILIFSDKSGLGIHERGIDILAPSSDEAIDSEIDDLADDAERCPICNRVNSPNLVNTCKHYVGLLLDNSLSRNEYDFDENWDEARNIIEELDSLQLVSISSSVSDDFDNETLDGLVNCDQYWWNSHTAVLHLEPIGIFGDAGMSVYHASPETLYSGVTSSLRRIINKAVAISNSMDR